LIEETAMGKRLTLLMLLVCADGLMTLRGIQMGFMQEANPYIFWLVMEAPILFLFAKVLLVSLGSAILWRYRDNVWSIHGVTLLLLTYSLLLFHHFNCYFRFITEGL
jgi:hypothetical protein